MIFEEMMRDEREAGRQERRLEGKLEGEQAKAQNTALNMHKKGYPEEAIAEVLEVDIEMVRDWISELEPETK